MGGRVAPPILPHPRPEAGNTNWWRLGPWGRGGQNGNRQCETRGVCLPVSSGRLLGIQLGTFAWKPIGDVSFEASSGHLLASQLGMFAWKPARHVCFEASLGGLLASQLGMLAFSGRLLANQLETPLFAHSCFIKGPSGTAVWRNHIIKGRFGTAACAQLRHQGPIHHRCFKLFATTSSRTDPALLLVRNYVIKD